MSAPTVFFTGFPGFLGSALLERVLARSDGPVGCLVQPQYLDRARQRAQSITERVDSTETSIRLYEGDIAEPDMGLGTRYAELESVRTVFHLAAVYDLGVAPELAEEINVRGTEHCLEFATDIDVDHFHYISTCYVSGRYDGVFTEAQLQEGQSFNNHYEETKYRAEIAVQERMNRGFPATVYRPAIVVGDSQTGETDKFDGPYNLLELLLAQPRWLSLIPSLPGSADAELNVVPRDFVVDAIGALSDRETTVGNVYHLCDPTPLPVEQFVETLADAVGHQSVTIPMTKQVALATVSALASASVRIDGATLDYLDHPTRYACPNTQRALTGTGIEVPPFESYVSQIVDFARNNPGIGDEPMV